MNSLISRSSLFDDFFKDLSPGFFVRPLHGDKLPDASQIKIDVKESNDDFVVHAELPGVAKENINVSIDGSVVQIRAELQQKDEQREGDKVLRSERYFGSVTRSFQLPDEVDSGKAKAKYNDGVLELKLPKKAERNSQKLMIE